jgi:hypothetical protein
MNDHTSSYIQLRNNNNNMLNTKSKHSLSHFISIYSYSILFILIFIICFFIFFHTKNSHISLNHRLKRQVLFPNTTRNDKRINDLLWILLHRTNSSVLADCTMNMALDGIYRLPSTDSLSSQIIHLIEKSFENEMISLKRVALKIRAKLNQTSNYFADNSIDKFRDEFSLYIRILLASQIRIKEIDFMIASNDNGGSYIIKYSRMNNSVPNIIDYETINNDIIKQNTILQTFTISNARETMNNDQQHVLFANGWWLGPVLCEKNKNETSMMAHVFPLINK